MNAKTARILSFALSISGLIIAVFYLGGGANQANKSTMYLGLVLLLSSLIIRTLMRFKPEWFNDKNAE